MERVVVEADLFAFKGGGGTGRGDKGGGGGNCNIGHGARGEEVEAVQGRL